MTDEHEPPSSLHAAGLLVRLAAMIYEAVLLFAVSYALLATMQWSYPLPPAPRALLQGTLFVAAGAYFVICWARTGQTLALKAWRLKVIDSDGRPPRSGRAIARYLLAWHLWLPGLAIAAALQLGTVSTLIVLAVGFGFLLVPAVIDHRRRLLHDILTGTRVVRVPRPSA
ncbi:MAG: RDD family protein [Burkholderiaceae bacterium]